MKFSIATAKDADELNLLVNSAYRGESSKKGWTTEADLLGGQRTDADLLRGIIADDKNKVVIGKNDQGQIISCVHLTLNEDGIYLGMLVTKPDIQGAGLGKQMMQESERLAKSWNYNRIYMSVIDVRTELIAFYERRGYKRTGQTKAFPYGDEKFGLPKRDDLKFIVMEKFL